MKKTFLFCLLIAYCTFVSATTYYISSSGNDAASGLSESTPWRTITKVNATFLIFKPGDRILFKSGEIFHGTLKITASGVSGNPITIGAYGVGEKPVITGLTTATSWINEGNGIYSSPVTIANKPNYLVIDDNWHAMGRYPNDSYLTYESFSTNVSITDNQLPSTPNWKGAEAVIRKNGWTVDRCLITDHSGARITYKNLGTSFNGTANYGYFLQNDLKTLDLFGEWYYSGTRLYVYFGNRNPVNHKIQVPTIDNHIYNFRQSYITVENIRFTGAGSSSVVMESFADYCVVKDCNINFSGEHGIKLPVARWCTVHNNVINHSVKSGVFVDSGRDAVITDNTINSSGMLLGAGLVSTAISAGIYCTLNDDALIQYNNIDSSGYNGIRFNGSRVQVKNNYIKNSVLLVNDGGAIYTTGKGYSGRIIEGNIVVNSFGNTDGTDKPLSIYAEGIYLDAPSLDITVKNNTTTGCRRSGIFFHESHDNICTGNTAFDNLHQVRLQSDGVYKDDYIRNIVFNDNILIAKAPTALVIWARSGQENIPKFFVADNNYYARPIDDGSAIYTRTPVTGIKYRTLADWQSYTGQDANSFKSAVAIKDTTEIELLYNAGKTNKIITLSSPKVDVKGNKYYSSITLLPFTSVVLMNDPNPSESAFPVYVSSQIANSAPSTLEITYDISLANIIPPGTAFAVMVNSVARAISKITISETKVFLTLVDPVEGGDVVTISYTKPDTNPLQSVAGANATTISSQSVSNNVNPPVPVYLSSVIQDPTASILEMTYDINLANIVPDPSAFKIMVNSVSRTVSTVAISDTTVFLTLSSPVAFSDVVTVAYTVPDANQLQSTQRRWAFSSGTQKVSNNLNSASAPVYLSSAIAHATPSIVELSFDLTLANIIPPSTAFEVRVNSVSRTVSTIAISGTKVLLTLSNAVVYGDVVTVAYTKPATNALQASSGGQAATFFAKSVTNNLLPPIPLYLSSAINNSAPDLLEMTYDIELANIIPATSAFSVRVNSALRTVNSVAISGTKLQLTLASPVLSDDVVTVAYTVPETSQLQSTLRRWAISSGTQTVLNNVSSVAVPYYMSSVIENATPSLLEMTYDIELANIIPATSAFSVRVNSALRTVNSVAISGKKVLLTLASPVIPGDYVTVAYSIPGTNQLQSILFRWAYSSGIQTVSNNVNSTPVPYYLSSVIENSSPSLLEMTYDIELTNIVPTTSAFSVRVNSVSRTVSTVAISGTKVLLSLASPVTPDDVVTVAYSVPGTNQLQSTLRRWAYSSGIQTVLNNVSGTPIPYYLSSVIENSTPSLLEMTYDIELANYIISPTAAFSVRVNSISRTVSTVAISGTKVLLTLASPIEYGNTVSVAYTRPSTNPLQSSLRRWANSLSAQSVSNNIQTTYKSAQSTDTQTNSPIYLGSTINDSSPGILEMTYSLSLAPLKPARSAFVVSVNGVNKSVNQVDISDNKIQLMLESDVIPGDIITIAYKKPETDPIQATSGEPAASLSAQPVSNNCRKSANNLTWNHGNISIYPNPAREFINIYIVEPTSEHQFLRIYDFSGRVLLETRLDQDINNFQIPINLESGLYIIRVTKDNLTIHSQHLIITN